MFHYDVNVDNENQLIQNVPILPCCKIHYLSIHQISLEMPHKRFHFHKESYIFKGQTNLCKEIMEMNQILNDLN